MRRTTHPFAPNGFTGIHQGAAIVFFAYIGFDAISTAAEETKNPQRNLPIGILGGLADLHVDLRDRRRRADRAWCRTRSSRSPIRWRARSSWPASKRSAGSWRSVPSVSMSAVLLVFQYGQPRIFFAMARDGLLPQWAARLSPRTKIPAVTTILTGVFVAGWSLIGDAGETYDLTNIGTLFAFMLVSHGRARAALQRARSSASVPRAVRLGRDAAVGRRRVCSS